MVVKNITHQAGFLLVETDVETKKFDITIILRAADIPTGLTYSQVQAITGLANIIGVLIKELIERGIIGEDFLDGYGLEDIVDQIDNAGGSYTEPDIGIDT